MRRRPHLDPRSKLAACAASLAVAAASGLTAAATPAAASPLSGRGMWIWYVSRSDGGSPASIIARAQAAGIKTLIIKAGDGGTYWSQFSPQLVSALRSGGINVCAWQYVYGADPVAEADVGARAVANGAQCLVIDAEAEYEGRYASAQLYLRTLRAAIGAGFPVALASFPYVDFHPGFPFSVFLGPGGAQYDMPQMYWSQIGASVESVYNHTYVYNRIYGRPIAPLGETDAGVSAGDAMLFRGLDVRYRAPGVSWWDYAWTSADSLWSAISGYYTVISSVTPLGYPDLGVGSKGDDVVRLQEVLAGVYGGQGIDGDFGPQTQANLEAFQRSRGLVPTGTTNFATWSALRGHPAIEPSWSGFAGASGDSARAARFVARAPLSASLPAVRDEIWLEPRRAEAARRR